MNDLDDIDERERQEAEALARALDGQAAHEAPEDALAVAAFLRAARGAHGAEAHVAALEPSVLATAPMPAAGVRPRPKRRALLIGSSVLALAAGALLLLRAPETQIVARSTTFPAWGESAEGGRPMETAASTPSPPPVASVEPGEVAEERMMGDAARSRRPAPGFVDPESESLAYCEQARDSAIEALLREGAVDREAVRSVRETIARTRAQEYGAALDVLTRTEQSLLSARAPIPRSHAALLRHALVHERARRMLAHGDPDTVMYLIEAARTFEGRLRNCTGRFADEARRRALPGASSP